MHWADLATSGASLFIVATATTKTMVPLRILTIAANVFFSLIFADLHLWLPMALQIVALPLNSYRLYQMLDLIKNVRTAVGGNTTMEWLKPFMTSRSFKTGDILFAKGEPADRMFCTVTGRYRLRELGIELKPGEVVGELAMLAPDNRRTATLECIEVPAGRCQSLTSKSSSSITRTRPSASISCASPRRGCSTTFPGWKPKWLDSTLPRPRRQRSNSIIGVAARTGNYAPNAPRTRSGENGSSRSRTPVSLAMALPTAQATSGTPSSPPPVG